MNKNKFAGGWLGKRVSLLCFRKVTRLAVGFKRNRCCAGDPGTCTLIMLCLLWREAHLSCGIRPDAILSKGRIFTFYLKLVSSVLSCSRDRIFLALLFHNLVSFGLYMVHLEDPIKKSYLLA